MPILVSENAILYTKLRLFLLNRGIIDNVEFYFDGFKAVGAERPKYGYKASDYLNYTDDSSLALAFSGALWELLNRPEKYPEMKKAFDKVFEEDNSSYEFHDSWNLTVYRNGDNSKIKKTF